MATKTAKRTRKKFSGEIKKQAVRSPQQPEEIDLTKLSTLKLSRMLQDELMAVIRAKDQMAICQQRIWMINGVIDQRELEEDGAKEAPKPE